MLYNFKCKNCGETKQIDIPSNELIGLEVICDKCNNRMIRDWKANINIDVSDKSSNIEQMSWVKGRMKNRPTGKTQVYY